MLTIKANSLQPIYLAGTNFGWLNEAKEMTYSNGVFTYTQETNSFNDTFRFLCNKDAYWPAYSKAYVNDNTKAKYRETAVGDEFNFNLYVAAESHTISLNINTLEVTITATNVKPLYCLEHQQAVHIQQYLMMKLLKNILHKMFNYLKVI